MAAKSAITQPGSTPTPLLCATTPVFGNLMVGNTGINDESVDVTVSRSEETVYLCRDIRVRYGEPPVVIFPRLVLETGDILSVACSGTVTAIFNYWET